MCNIGMHGTDGHGHPCKDGTYCCYCDDYREPQLPCNASVGYENTTMRFGQFVGHCKHARDIVEKAECWRANSPAKMGGPLYSGGWYSPESTGCSDPLNPTDNCTWRVVSAIVTNSSTLCASSIRRALMLVLPSTTRIHATSPAFMATFSGLMRTCPEEALT